MDERTKTAVHSTRMNYVVATVSTNVEIFSNLKAPNAFRVRLRNATEFETAKRLCAQRSKATNEYVYKNDREGE